LEEFKKAAKSKPSFVEAYVNMAIVYLDRMNVPPAALFVLKDAIKENPGNAMLYFHTGKARLNFTGIGC